ncbi:tubulin--tyrosine ligase-like protein 12 [Glandiceps talaboti]
MAAEHAALDNDNDGGDYGDFLNIHRVQLENSFVPELYWRSLYIKLKNELYDAGSMFMMVQVEEQEEEEKPKKDNSGNEDVIPEVIPLKVVVSNEDDLDVGDPQSIYLIDHAWTYREDGARQQLQQVQGLLERMVALMNIETNNKNRDDVIDSVIHEMWKYNQTYNIGNQEVSAEDKLPLWYIMDEFGSRIRHSDQPTMKTSPFYYVPTQLCFTLLWPVRDMDYAEEVTRDYAYGITEPLLRQIHMLPWQPADLTYISMENRELDVSYYEKVFNSESRASEDEMDNSFLDPRPGYVYKVYTDIYQCRDYLNHPRFTFVESKEEADILWLQPHYKHYKMLATESDKYINQFPSEGLLTTKDLFAKTGLRFTPGGPRWLQKTYDLINELPQFVSCFQQRERRGEDNVWICKTWNLSRGLGHCVSNNLSQIVRLTETTAPKIACEYVTDPVLFQRDGIGKVKMDFCFTVFLRSIKPLKVFVHRNFSLRFSCKPFSLDTFDDYVKHFTVMNYMDYSKLLQIHWHEFIPLFEQQYPDYKWEKVEESIFQALRELFQASALESAPKGIAHNPQSRAVYSIDLILKWAKNDDGEKYMQPVLFEANYCPDNTRMCKYHPEFFNDAFSALFLDDITDRRVARLL